MNEEENIPKKQEATDDHQADNTLVPGEIDTGKTNDTNASEIPQPENMEVHHHPDIHHKKKKWKEYFLEFAMIFLAVTMGFFAEQIRERHVEKERLNNYFGSMVLDINSNIDGLDSAIRENSKMTLKYDTIVKSFLNGGDTVNRTAFARHMGAVWYRGFRNRNETFEQMKSSGSLRYIDDFKLLTAIMQYVRATNFAEYRTENFERKYFTEYFIPAIYKNYDLPCQFFLDSAYTNNPKFIATLDKHTDILKGREAENFKQDVGRALMLRLERLRVSVAAYRIAKYHCNSLKQLLEKYLE
jgi:hypothetical protein